MTRRPVFLFLLLRDDVVFAAARSLSTASQGLLARRVAPPGAAGRSRSKLTITGRSLQTSPIEEQTCPVDKCVQDEAVRSVRVVLQHLLDSSPSHLLRGLTPLHYQSASDGTGAPRSRGVSSKVRTLERSITMASRTALDMAGLVARRRLEVGEGVAAKYTTSSSRTAASASTQVFLENHGDTDEDPFSSPSSRTAAASATRSTSATSCVRPRAHAGPCDASARGATHISGNRATAEDLRASIGTRSLRRLR